MGVNTHISVFHNFEIIEEKIKQWFSHWACYCKVWLTKQCHIFELRVFSLHSKVGVVYSYLFGSGTYIERLSHTTNVWLFNLKIYKAFYKLCENLVFWWRPNLFSHQRVIPEDTGLRTVYLSPSLSCTTCLFCLDTPGIISFASEQFCCRPSGSVQIQRFRVLGTLRQSVSAILVITMKRQPYSLRQRKSILIL